MVHVGNNNVVLYLQIADFSTNFAAATLKPR
jgi:hypothetical protein